MDLDSRIFLIGAITGIVLMAASFVAYVAEPLTGYIVVFAIGLVLLAGGYGLTFMENRRSSKAYWEAADEQERDGVFLILDEDYVPYADSAVIEDLRGL